MSKVKSFVDQKSKAIHRIRRYESRKKNIARQKFVHNISHWKRGFSFCGDMYVEQNGV